ncbi:MAG: tRNA (adenosine(37)-N6)-dimethylallyltransferase MiaA [Clostridiaceae bacterium]|nr:tRNA (adenosine(37)-N6)-dimethylallyltransferase MiaA [Clostridiaceae bacterium]
MLSKRKDQTEKWAHRLAHFCDFIVESAREQSNNAAIVICGPTASGKSSLAMCVAENLDGLIVSADSMQLYRGFDIGTAKPTEADQKKIAHAMIDILDPDQSYSVALYTESVTKILLEAQQSEKQIVICGGTGQYITALLDGISYAKHSRDHLLRAEIEKEVDNNGLEMLWQELVKLDPQAAQTIAPSDRRRIIRFHEQYRLTGKTRTEINQQSRVQDSSLRFVAYYLDPGKVELNHRIIDRVDLMLASGLVDETRTLLDKYPDTSLQPYSGIGYREAVAYLQGKYSLSEMREWIIIHTRQYAKRQRTWFRPRTDLYRL